MKKIIPFISLAMFLCTFHALSQGIIINHTCTKIEQIHASAIQTAKQNLHIAYGHTSHGSQLTDGMTGLVPFMNSKGYANNLYSWNNGGTGGALDLHDYAMSGDVGYYPDWVNNTRNYLGTVNTTTGRGTGANADVNVIVWSWCGQVSGKYQAGTLQSEYINPMVQLETDYFGIKFVYMTGHLDHWDDANNKAANQVIRDFCIQNNKILYDFSDIESNNPDGVYFTFAGDDCSYYESATGSLLGNWAIEWQNSHSVNIDWYDCSSAHSEPLNANQKAYAAWWLWARLAGWDQCAGPSAPTVGTITQPTCAVSTGSIVLTGLPAGNWTINPGAIAGSGSSMAISGLAEGTYTFTVTNAAGCTSAASANVVINAQPATPTPIITLNGKIIHSDTANGNQWYNQYGLINGATNQDYTVITDGDYYVIVTINGCSSEPSNTIRMANVGIELTKYHKTISVYPNPVSNELVIEIKGNTKNTNFKILNSIGQVVFKGDMLERAVIQTKNFSHGIYLIKLENGTTYEFKKMVKE